MIDHREALIRMSAAAMTKASHARTRTDARAVHARQMAERDSMIILVRAVYSERYDPAVSEQRRIQNDSLQRLAGSSYDRAFYDLVVRHHLEGIARIDSMAPRLSREDVRRLAALVRSDEQNEIAKFQRKVPAN